MVTSTQDDNNKLTNGGLEDFFRPLIRTTRGTFLFTEQFQVIGLPLRPATVHPGVRVTHQHSTASRPRP